MKFHETKNKTKLPLEEFESGLYLKVQHRVRWFREEHPEGRIETEIVELTPEAAVIRATIYSVNPKGEYVKLANATKREDKSHFDDYIESAETGAIGRALALCGYGTQFTTELDERNRLADSPVKPIIPAPKVATSRAAPIKSVTRVAATPKYTNGRI
jgi:hypothetical protein